MGPPEREGMMEKWHFDGNPLEFLWMVKWAILMRELYKEKHPDTLDILLDTKKAEDALDQRGITDQAMTLEMLENALQLIAVFGGKSNE